MKVVFLGTPVFAVSSLEALVNNGFEIAAVVTAPDKPAGRGLQVRTSAVKEFALKHGIPVLQPVKLTDAGFLSEIRSLAPDLMIVVAFRMMPEALWSIPPLGTFNLHASLLPQYRGAAPINRAIINGETETGVTTFFLKQQIDTGNIIFRETTFIGADETAGELHDRLKVTGAHLVVKTVRAIQNGAVITHPQESFVTAGATLYEAPKIFPDDCLLHWDRPFQEVHNRIRGLSPFPGAYTLLHSGDTDIHVKIFRSRITPSSGQSLPGSLSINGDKLFVHCSDGLLEILELQQQGKRKMTAADFLRGFRNLADYRAR